MSPHRHPQRPSENDDFAWPHRDGALTQAPLGKRRAFEGVARRPDAGGTTARTLPRTQVRTPTNQAPHHPDRWVRKIGCSITKSETPHLIEQINHIPFRLADDHLDRPTRYQTSPKA